MIVDNQTPHPDYFVLDTSAFVFNYYYAMPPLTTSEGFPVGIIKGIDNMIFQLLNRFTTSQIIGVFDPKGGSFRQELYSEYKSNRRKTPEEIVLQIPVIKKYLGFTGISTLTVDNYEADDVIGTLVHQLYSSGKEAWIASADKDLMQLVNDSIKIFDVYKNKLIDVQGVKDKFQVYPHQIQDFLAICGDSSDNIPGIAGIGKVTASKLLQQYESLDNILNSLDYLPPKTSHKIHESREHLALSRDLVRIRTDVELPINSLADISMKSQDYQKLAEFYQEYEINGKFKENTQ